VNQQDEEAERYVYRDTLSKWAGEAASDEPTAFDPHTIFYDEDRCDEYASPPPRSF